LHNRYIVFDFASYYGGDIMLKWHEKDIMEILKELDVYVETGLQEDSVAERQLKYGKNQFAEQKGEGIGKKILHNLRDVTTIILLFAAALFVQFIGNGNAGLKPPDNPFDGFG